MHQIFTENAYLCLFENLRVEVHSETPLSQKCMKCEMWKI